MGIQLSAAEISDVIRQRIENFEVVSQARSEGSVMSVSDGIVQISGLRDVMQGEMIEFPR